MLVRIISKPMLAFFLILLMPLNTAARTNAVTYVKSAPLAGGTYNAFAINNNGEMFAWGDNWRNSLGIDNGYTDIPIIVKERMLSCTASMWAAFAIDIDYTLWGWASNNRYGMVGVGDSLKGTILPVKVMENVAAVSSGGEHCMALKKDGSLWVWGAYYLGQLGNGEYNKHFVDGIGEPWDEPYTTQYESYPIKLMRDVISICADNSSSYAVKMDGSLWAWGNNENWNLGDGTTNIRSVPVKIMDDVKCVEKGRLAVKNDNSLWSWGMGVSPVPVKIMDNVEYATEIEGNIFAAIKTDGSLWVWGNADYLPYKDNINLTEPYRILDNVAYVTSTFNKLLVLKTDGSLWELLNPSFLVDKNPSEIDNAPLQILDGIMQPVRISIEISEENIVDSKETEWSFVYNLRIFICNVKNIAARLLYLQSFPNN